MFKRLRAWWIDDVWTPFYCRHARFHLLRSRIDGSFLIVYAPPESEPDVPQHFIVGSYWTPFGCRRGVKLELWWHRFMSSDVGREFREIALANKNFKEPPHA